MGKSFESFLAYIQEDDTQMKAVQFVKDKMGPAIPLEKYEAYAAAVAASVTVETLRAYHEWSQS